MPCMLLMRNAQLCSHRVHEWVLKLTAIVVLLWVLRWGLHTKALSHDPAPEGPLPVLHPETCTPPWTDQQLHLPSSFFNKVPTSPLSSLLCVSLVYPSSTPFSSVLPPALPLAISLRPSLPPGVGHPLPSLTDPPFLAQSTGQHSLKDAYHSWKKDELCFQFDACPAVCGAKRASNNVCTM